MEEERIEDGPVDVVLPLVDAPFPILTGRAPAYPVSSSRVDSVRSRRPSIPYMIWSEPSSFGSTSATNCMNSSASHSRFR